MVHLEEKPQAIRCIYQSKTDLQRLTAQQSELLQTIGQSTISVLTTTMYPDRHTTSLQGKLQG